MLSKQPVCLHFHIFKNAGTTIDWILKKNFSKNHLTMDDQATNPAEIFNWENILNFLQKHSDVQAFSSHIIRFPIPEKSSFHFLPMVFIRHPIDRAFSVYSFKKRDSDNSIATIIAKTGTLKEFVNWSLSLKKYAVMKNFQVLYLSKSSYDNNPITLEDYHLALKRLQNCTVLGIVDRLDESLVVAEEELKKFFPKIDLSYKSQNVSHDRKNTLEERINDGRKKIGENLFDKLLSFNKYDLELYNFGNDELNQKIQKIHDFNNKLIDFRNRCQKLN
ncbi:MAG: sulfotransferase family protein [Nitrosopumilus sp.]|uniref:sulfotransferase family 2 domain-containing protein n=1 Tax=Nitrosopumilus sp. TaxID=2024843 RepID=UPI00247B8F2D|nr:sulfotransferase family 2 domain-containing protein [Nitrosopumilus sp.]MCV0393503.1 sulfotransferase family protein [Nitrosopumilus sp.]